MKTVENIGSLKAFDKLVSNYLRDGYVVTSLFKDNVEIIVKLTHKNGKIVMGKYNYKTSEYSIR